MRLLEALLLFFAVLFAPEEIAEESNFQEEVDNFETICGDAICQYTESCESCAQDCGACKEQILEQIKESIVWVKYEYFAEIQTNEYQYNSATGSGVIIDENKNYLFILSNRHVLDCRYTRSCSKPWFENMTVRTQDGITHTVERKSFDPEFLDIAFLRVRKAVDKTYTTASQSETLTIGETVVAAGYPASQIGGGIVEYSSKEGSVLDVKELILPNGRKLESIESNAFTYYGSSGGGLFNDKGELVGISTWGIDLNTPDSSESIAIKIDSLVDQNTFLSCSDGEYIDLDGSCKDYHGNNHRLVCFFSDQRTFTPLDGRVYYNGVNQGKTVQGCREIIISDVDDAEIEFDRDYAAGIITYNIDYSAELKKDFATSWFVE